MKKRLFIQGLAGSLLAASCLAGTAHAREVLIIDVTENVSRGIFGGREDYSYPVGGRKITRHEFNRTTRGHADVFISEMNSDHVKVHGWADAFSGYTFTLKVWAEE